MNRVTLFQGVLVVAVFILSFFVAGSSAYSQGQPAINVTVNIPEPLDVITLEGSVIDEVDVVDLLRTVQRLEVVERLEIAERLEILEDHEIQRTNPVPIENVYEYCTTKKQRNLKCDKEDPPFDVLFTCNTGESAVEVREDEDRFYWKCEDVCSVVDPLIPLNRPPNTVNFRRIRSSRECFFEKPLCGEDRDGDGEPDERWSCAGESTHIKRLDDEVTVHLVDGVKAEQDTIYSRWQCGRSAGGNVNDIILSDICKKVVPKKGECSPSVANSCEFGDVKDSPDDDEYDKWRCVGGTRNSAGALEYDSGTGSFRGGDFPYYREDYVTVACRALKDSKCYIPGYQRPSCLVGSVENVVDEGETWSWQCRNAGGHTVSCRKLKPSDAAPSAPAAPTAPVVPTNPTNFRVSRDDTTGVITLSWNKPTDASGVTGYQYRYDTSDWVPVEGEETVGDIISFTIEGLASDVDIDLFQIRAVLDGAFGDPVGTGNTGDTPNTPDPNTPNTPNAPTVPNAPNVSGVVTGANACGSRLERIVSAVPDFFSLDHCGGSVGYVPVLGDRYVTKDTKKGGCRLGTVFQDDAVFVVRREGGDVTKELVVRLECEFGFLTPSDDPEDEPTFDQFLATKDVTVEMLPYQDTVSFSIPGNFYPDSTELGGLINYGDSVRCTVTDVFNAEDFNDPNNREYDITTPDFDVVSVSKLGTGAATFAAAFEKVLRRHKVPIYDFSADRPKIVGASVFLTYLWGHYTGFIKLPKYSIEGLLTNPLAFVTGADPADHTERISIIQQQDNEDLQRYQILSHLFASETDPRYREQNFGFLTPKEAEDEYTQSYEDRLKYYLGTTLGDFIFKVPAVYR